MADKTKPKVLKLTATPGRTDAQMMGDTVLKPEVNAGFLVDTFKPLSMGELTDIVQSLQDVVARVKSGDLTDIESMLISQATALQTLFTSLANRASAQEYLTQYKTYMTLALKAQSNSRATLQTLLELKFPRTTAFVKQANIANGPQQVNNCSSKETTEKQTESSDTHAQESKTEQNKLSQIEDTRHEREILDIRGTATSGGTNSEMETVGKIHRTKKQPR